MPDEELPNEQLIYLEPNELPTYTMQDELKWVDRLDTRHNEKKSIPCGLKKCFPNCPQWSKHYNACKLTEKYEQAITVKVRTRKIENTLRGFKRAKNKH